MYIFGLLLLLSFAPVSQQLFGADVAELKSEEIYIIEEGANFGWPYMDSICVIGRDVYAGKSIPLLHHKYIFGDFDSNLLTIMNTGNDKWTRVSLPVKNKPADPFQLYAVNNDESKELYVMGILNSSKGAKGAVN